MPTDFNAERPNSACGGECFRRKATQLRLHNCVARFVSDISVSILCHLLHIGPIMCCVDLFCFIFSRVLIFVVLVIVFVPEQKQYALMAPYSLFVLTISFKTN